MKILKVIAIVLFIPTSMSSFSQEVTFYIKINDPKIVPEIVRVIHQMY
jgi:hypothetical protein